MISIQLNGLERRLEEPLALSKLLQELKIPLPALAVAVNSQIVPRSDFETFQIRDRDCVEILRAVGGG